MLAEPSLTLIIALFIAAGAGWFLGRYRRPPQVEHRSELSKGYFQGLRFLLNEEPDKALEVFLRMVDVDNDTVETHFALGNLYRRRGQVDRAIRVHENLIVENVAENFSPEGSFVASLPRPGLRSWSRG